MIKVRHVISLIFLVSLCILPWSGLDNKVFAQPRTPHAAAKTAAVIYECPMHPEVTSKKRGKCPKCGMTFRVRENAPPVTANSDAGTAAPEKSDGSVASNLRIPDALVVDQDGRKLKFYSDLVKDKTVAINFIFTTCTTICPTLTATFRRVQQNLGVRAGRDVHLISISVDPTTDVPERLKDYATKFKAGPGWTFVTGGKSEIDSLLKAFGALSATKNDHTPMVLIGNDPAAHWTRTYGAAAPSVLVKAIDEAAAKKGPAASSTAGSSAPAKSTGKSAAANYFPNNVLLTQDNKPVHFYDDMLKGKVVVISFIFTTCKGVCSPMTANLARAQDYLAEHVGRDVVMISLSVDPLTDTPAVLKAYADKFKVKPGWFFLTGEKKNVDWVLYKLGGYTADKEQHSSVLIIGNEATGEWMKIHAMAKPAAIADAVSKLLTSKP